MLTFIKEILTWWNHQTFGTRLQTIFFGKLVGIDGGVLTSLLHPFGQLVVSFGALGLSFGLYFGALGVPGRGLPFCFDFGSLFSSFLSLPGLTFGS